MITGTSPVKEGPFSRWNHEYWPWYLIYLPVIPILLWNAIRLRSLVFFTNVDPAIDLSGFFGERKSEIYMLMPKGAYPATILVHAGTSLDEVRNELHDAGVNVPMIAKPDVGERGEGVVRVMDETALKRLVSSIEHPTLLQNLITGEHEYGLMFARDPDSNKVSVLSITGKRFLSVEGDGRATVEELLGRSYRGSTQVERLRSYKTALLASVPKQGERVMVEPIGNHCRGTTFVDECALITPQLHNAVETLIQATDGVYYGRLDVRSESVEAFQRGEFSVVELNGVSSEPGHIYDPTMSILRCWSELVRHVRYMPRISEKLMRKGHAPASVRTVLLRCGTHFDPPPFWRWIIRMCAGPPPTQAPSALHPRPGTSF